MRKKISVLLIMSMLIQLFIGVAPILAEDSNGMNAEPEFVPQLTVTLSPGVATGSTSATITREEAMVMYQRAMEITKLSGSDQDRYLNYTDFAQVSSWAESYVKEVMSAQVFNGTTATTISPKSNLTYAKAAQAIKNLLVKSGLING
ncbi:MAG: S-layer homology domain-containing protein [Desulfotomaculaceae bacterium]|nr:S-layer homology domain-containing protein [Desulfotomaculaceae bacterium]